MRAPAETSPHQSKTFSLNGKKNHGSKLENSMRMILQDFTHTNISPLGNAVLACVYCLLYVICFFVLFSGSLETLLCVRTYTSQ